MEIVLKHTSEPYFGNSGSSKSLTRRRRKPRPQCEEHEAPTFRKLTIVLRRVLCPSLQLVMFSSLRGSRVRRWQYGCIAYLGLGCRLRCEDVKHFGDNIVRLPVVSLSSLLSFEPFFCVPRHATSDINHLLQRMCGYLVRGKRMKQLTKRVGCQLRYLSNCCPAIRGRAGRILRGAQPRREKVRMRSGDEPVWDFPLTTNQVLSDTWQQLPTRYIKCLGLCMTCLYWPPHFALFCV